jgi:hypothetical protein
MPLLNEVMDNQLPLLSEKLFADTKSDIAKSIGGSKSQENLSQLYELDHPRSR